MNIKISDRLQKLSGYAFAEIDKKVAALRDTGARVYDFGVGDPTEPTPEIVRHAIKTAVDRRAQSGYPSYVGSAEFRAAIAYWTKQRFGVQLNAEKEICASIGSKEAVFNFPEAFLNRGDVVIIPNPGYPPYTRGTQFAEGEVYYVDLLPENSFLPDLDSIPKDVAKKSKIMWINYPNNPTGATADADFYRRVVEFGRKHDIIIASDEAYSENYYSGKPSSILEFAREGVIAFNSLSKRSCMTGYRVGWVAGDERIVAAFKKLKTNIDSGTPTFIQDAAVAALSDESHVAALRELYKKKRDVMVDALKSIGLPECRPDATLYIWQRVPDNMNAVEFAEKLLDKDIAMIVTPGSAISEDTPHGNPGDKFVRLALVPTLEECIEAAEKIRNHLRV